MTSWREEIESNEHLQAFRAHASEKSVRTEKAYFCALKRIIDFFEIRYSEFDPKKLKQGDYDAFMQFYLKRWKRSSLNFIVSIFKILDDLYDLNLRTKKFKEIDKEKTDYVTFEELQEILNKADKEVAALAAFMFCTGLRPVSVLTVEKGQLMLDAEHPYIKNVYLKGGKRQDIVFLYPEIVVPLLRWYMTFKTQNQQDYSENDLLFVSQKKTSSSNYIYKRIRDGCGPILGRGVSPRMFRKGLGVHTKELGLQDEVRRMIMGHSDVRTTIDAYSDYNVKDIVREIEAKTVNTHDQPPAGFVNQAFQPEKEKCRFCGGLVDEKMVRCPHCWEKIKVICPGCQRFVNSEWEICAYCETPLKKDKKHVVGLKR